MNNKFFLVLFPFYLILIGCETTIERNAVPTVTALVITATLPPTGTSYPSETAPPPPPSPTVAPITGKTSTQLNVRADPSTAGDVLGIIPAGSTVSIMGQVPGGNWYQILYPEGTENKGWVTAQFVETATNVEVPMIGSGASSEGPIGTITLTINVRSGPGTNFDSLGTLNTNDVVSLSGKNQSGTWLQIDYAQGPEGTGWVSSGYVDAENTDTLPIVSELGDVIGTGTPIDTPQPPTPTIIAAPLDGDSAQSPIKTVRLGGADAYTVLYNGEVSAPQGDSEDWISVTSGSNLIWVGMSCKPGSAMLTIENGNSNQTMECNSPLRSVSLNPNSTILIRINPNATAETLTYTNYTLTIKVIP